MVPAVWDLYSAIRFIFARPTFIACIVVTATCKKALILGICTGTIWLAARVTCGSYCFHPRIV
eukprot:scaffold19435_cov73-Skeletonema_marinoi.AAC.1